jgi:two-component system cell cycle response regulator CtrA
MQHDLVHALRDENASLRERIRQLEDQLVPSIDIPVEWRLTATEQRLFAHLASRKISTKSSLHAAAYGHLLGDPPPDAVIESHLSKMRRKLRPHGYQIRNERFAGYRLIGCANG